MLCPSYSALAECYDELMESVDYSATADFCEAQFSCHMEKKPAIVLDLGCGTGMLTGELCKRGYDMIGVDLSSEMLSRAAMRAEADGQRILYLCQDMRSFDLFGTVDAVVCSLDCINYLTKREDVALCFDRVHTFLAPGGIFIFDVNTLWKFEHVFGDESYILENENTFLGWQNEYNPRTRLCRFYLTFFTEQEDGAWARTEELQTERAYSDRQLTGWLQDAGFSLLGIYADTDGTPAGNEDRRHYFVCRRME